MKTKEHFKNKDILLLKNKKNIQKYEKVPKLICKLNTLMVSKELFYVLHLILMPFTLSSVQK